MLKMVTSIAAILLYQRDPEGNSKNNGGETTIKHTKCNMDPIRVHVAFFPFSGCVTEYFFRKKNCEKGKNDDKP